MTWFTKAKACIDSHQCSVSCCVPAAFSLAFSSLLLTTPLLAQTHSETPAELAIKTFQVAPGLQVALFAQDPLLFNPVAFSIDEQGRFFIAETHRYKDSIFDIWAASQRWKDADASFRTVEDRAAFLAREYATNLHALTGDSELIRLLEDTNGDGRADSSAVFADGFNQTVSGTAAGILARRGQVWFACIPDLWRFTARAPERLHSGFGVHIGVSGHDLHGLVMGPDGKIYFSVGDRGAKVTTKEGNVLDYPDTGAVFRCNPDGTQLEAFAIGLRNPQELAFDHHGNLWTHDNDTAGADKSRVLHVVEGGDYGWRYSYQFMEGFGPWVQEQVWAGGIDDVLPNAGYGAQGPAGLAYYPGVGLPGRFASHFIACDFPQGIWSFTFTPKGASYQITNKEKFLWNIGATDVEFGPDGGLYVSDWGRQYPMPNAGRIYRVFDPEQRNSPATAEVKRLLAGDWDELSHDALLQLLGHSDLRIRTEAQFQLERLASRPLDEAVNIAFLLHGVALRETNQLARIHAIRALEKVRPDDGGDTISQLLEDPDPEIRAQAARMIGATDWRVPASTLVQSLRDPSPRVRFFAATSIGKLAQARPAINHTNWLAPILEFLRDNNDQDAYLTHAGMMALLGLGDFGLIQQAAQDKSAAVRRAALLCLRRLENPEIARFLNDPEPRLRYEAARAINDLPINDALPELAAFIAKIDCPENVMSRAINANFRIGKEQNVKMVAGFTRRSDIPAPLRALAVEAIGDWPQPPPRDRVTGLWRPLEARNLQMAKRAYLDIAGDIFERAPEAVQLAAVRVAGQLRTKEVAHRFFGLLQDTNTPIAIRREIPAVLIEVHYHRLGDVLEITLADSDPALRRAGIQLLDRIEVPDAAALLERLLAVESDLRLQQTALITLGRIEDTQADAVLARLLDKLLSGEIHTGLQLDLLEAAGERTSPEVQSRLTRHRDALPAEDSLAPFRIALTGGDAESGRKLFHERDDLGCLRCHSINKRGGNVGPDLAGIAKQKTREYLLESLVEPNKQIAPGYENIVLTLKDGEFAAGVVREESHDQVTLQTPEGELQRIEKSEIEGRHAGLSSMPDNLHELLSKRELRDLIEYLAGLQ